MFSKSLNNNAQPQVECEGLKNELKAWKEDV